jgi:hypothetical protein
MEKKIIDLNEQLWETDWLESLDVVVVDEDESESDREETTDPFLVIPSANEQDNQDDGGDDVLPGW